MTFTYDQTLSTNTALVRFWTGDTDSAGYWLSDETIAALLTSEGGVGGAVVAGLEYIVGQLSKPGVKVDWLTVDNKTARDGYERLLMDRRRRFGAAAVTASVTHVYRADSLATEEPDYSEGAEDA